MRIGAKQLGCVISTPVMLTIMDYNAGNLRSVKRACDAVGLASTFSDDPEAVLKADRVIFPGVGHAATAAKTLHETGLGEALLEVVKKGTPVLGICVGAQLMLDGSEEGDAKGLGVIPGYVRRFNLADKSLKVPHMGWNEVKLVQKHPLLEGLSEGDELYFVHSYYMAPTDNAHCFAVTEYGHDFACAIGRDNVFATQFHPEKSGRFGLELLKRFGQWEGS